MKKRIRNLIVFVVMAAAIAVSLIQLRIPVVKADGCPPAETVGCGCRFSHATSVDANDGTTIGWRCTYYCECCYCDHGGGDPMAIEREVTVYN